MSSKNIRVLLFPVGGDYDRRGDAEFIENSSYDINQLRALPNDVQVYTLSEFMDICNDQQFDIEEYWVTYINFIPKQD